MSSVCEFSLFSFFTVRANFFWPSRLVLQEASGLTCLVVCPGMGMTFRQATWFISISSWAYLVNDVTPSLSLLACMEGMMALFFLSLCFGNKHLQYVLLPASPWIYHKLLSNPWLRVPRRWCMAAVPWWLIPGLPSKTDPASAQLCLTFL